MLRVSDRYQQKYHQYSRLVFDLVSEDRKELEAFISSHKQPLGSHQMKEENGQFKIQLIEDHYEVAQALVRHYNLEKSGQLPMAERLEFVEHFGREAITGIAYATSLIPENMAPSQYATLVFAAFENLGDSPEFDARVLELLGCRTSEQHWKAYNQLQLIRQLLFEVSSS